MIFDLDGTLVDSEGLCSRAFLDLVPELDLSLEDMVARCRGQKLAHILGDIEEHISRSLPAGFEQEYRARVASLFETELRPVPGVMEMLAGIPYPICVASSGPREKICQALTVSSLFHFFGENVFSSYEVGSWKPEPGLLLHAAEAMGFSPGQCAVVEDSAPGIQAAVAAGMRPFYFLPDKEARYDSGAVVFGSMAELPGLLNL